MPPPRSPPRGPAWGPRAGPPWGAPTGAPADPRGAPHGGLVGGRLKGGGMANPRGGAGARGGGGVRNVQVTRSGARCSERSVCSLARNPSPRPAVAARRPRNRRDAQPHGVCRQRELPGPHEAACRARARRAVPLRTGAAARAAALQRAARADHRPVAAIAAGGCGRRRRALCVLHHGQPAVRLGDHQPQCDRAAAAGRAR